MAGRKLPGHDGAKITRGHSFDSTHALPRAREKVNGAEAQAERQLRLQSRRGDMKGEDPSHERILQAAAAATATTGSRESIEGAFLGNTRCTDKQ
jgi:hypothetical protein